MNVHFRFALQLVALVAAYYGAGRIGLSWAFLHDYASSLWPPTGIAIAALLLFGVRLWPAVFAGALLVNASLGSWPIAFFLAIGNTLEAYVAARLVQRFAGGARAFYTPADSLRFVALAAVFSTAISASVGVGTLWAAGKLAAGYASGVWLTWWVADMLSAITIVPLFAVLRTPLARAWNGRQAGEALAILAVLLLVVGVVFGEWLADARTNYPLAFLPIAPLLWAAYRFGPHGAVIASFVISIAALIATAAGYGPFASAELTVALTLVQAFVATLMFSALLLAGVAQQQRDNQQTLIAQAGLLRAQSEASPDGYLVVSPEGRMLAFNQRFVEMWGFSAELIAAGSDYALLDAARMQVVDGDAFIAQVKHLYAAGNEQSHEEILFKDGRVFERHGVPINTDDGRYMGFVWYFRDISARKRAENALRDKEERIRLLLNSMGEAMYGIDPQGRCTFVNAACLKLLGFKHEQQLLRRNIHDVIHGRRADGRAYNPADCAMDRAIHDNVSIHRQEEWLWRTDGSGFAVEFSSYPIRKDGATIGAVVSFTDITERKRANLALRDAEERVRRVMAAVPVVVFATDREGTLTLVEGSGMAGLSPAARDLVGRSVFDLHRDNPDATAQLKRALAGETLTHTFNFDGLYFETFFAPLYDASGGLIGTTGVSVDVTQQRRAEEELFRASKLESIGVLAGGIAHDFNNILTAIIGNLALARLYTADDALLKCVSESEKAALRARGLTQQLLAFSSGGKPIKKIFLLAPLLDTIAEFALHGSNVRAQVQVPDDLWPIEGDEGQLSQVIHNLVLNAQQAMPEGGVVQLSARNTSIRATDSAVAPGDYVEIVVRDRGVGIAPDDLAKIFDPFFTTKTHGSGLGLTSTYWIVKRHDGHIGVQSQPGRGAEFIVHLPRAHGGANPVVADAPLFARGHGRILFMDDDTAIRAFTEALLAHLGYRVVSCADGGAALTAYRQALARGERFDAVILDLTVRDGMGGADTLTQLRRLDPAVKAVVSSGYSNDPVMAEYRHYGFSACIAKPYEAESLSRVLNDVIGDAPQRR